MFNIFFIEVWGDWGWGEGGGEKGGVGFLLVIGIEFLGGRIYDFDIYKMIFCDNFCYIGIGSSIIELSDFVF